MKLLALLLIILNITFFLWQYHSGAISLERDVLIDTTDTGQQITLISELNDSSSLKQAQSGLLWCAAGTAIEQSIRGAIFVSDFSLAPSSGARSGLLLAEWLDMHFVSHQTSLTRPKESPSILAFNDDSTALTKATPTPAKTSIPDEIHRHASQELERAEFDTVNELLIKKQAMVPKKNRVESSMCYEAGPFDTMQQFYSWRKQTGINSASIKSVSREEQKISDYMVYLPAGETYEQSLANVELLKQKGITDYWLFRKGEAKGDISLGVFSSEIRAETFKKQLAIKKLDALIRPRYKKAQRIYAHIHIKQEYEDNLIISRDRWQKTHPDFAIKVNNSCVFN
ncbi:hypothetical protein [Methylotuvimicrobium alcaliphilum]|uniref:SPOR domain-containing protein n=1 Tax=Methylotuvimicrobium alcaliphilum (strain DSM 19304 / NCIMB 14124 / VKM B-2133 / 20Z) TaxID=1091494 RepID=G4T2V3_META2|nr:hypothetical protein [Methylotuvimicrobium alcaliphilum]CCE23606.1 protein of unknown function [Methylotuvimicrobium alcaliphilum 20Z]